MSSRKVRPDCARAQARAQAHSATHAHSQSTSSLDFFKFLIGQSIISSRFKNDHAITVTCKRKNIVIVNHKMHNVQNVFNTQNMLKTQINTCKICKLCPKDYLIHNMQNMQNYVQKDYFGTKNRRPGFAPSLPGTRWHDSYCIIFLLVIRGFLPHRFPGFRRRRWRRRGGDRFLGGSMFRDGDRDRACTSTRQWKKEERCPKGRWLDSY